MSSSSWTTRSGWSRWRTRPRASACSSSSTWRGRTRGSRASRFTRPVCGWASGSPRRRPAEADLVMPVPDSGTPAAIGFARASGIPFNEGLIKNRYVGRTFIQPDQGLREQGIKLKFNPLDEVCRQARGGRRRLDRPRDDDAAARRDAVRGRRDRGARPGLVAADRLALLLRDRLRRRATSSSPPTETIEEIREEIGATSLAHLSLEGVQAATRRPDNQFCRACFTRKYPTRGPVGPDACEVQVRAGSCRRLLLEHAARLGDPAREDVGDRREEEESGTRSSRSGCRSTR